MTEVIHPPNGDYEGAVSTAADILKRGGIAALPTDTVYGLAVRADDDDAAGRLFRLKQRPRTNPVPILVSGAGEISSASQSAPAVARILAEHFWPGPLTIVVPKADHISTVIAAGGETVGLRAPRHPLTLQLLQACEILIAATSANLSGDSPAREPSQIPEELASALDLIIAAGPCPGGQPSTVVDTTCEPPCIIRSGPISHDRIMAAINRESS